MTILWDVSGISSARRCLLKTLLKLMDEEGYIINKQEFLPLLKVEGSAIREKALVCGDPARAQAIAAKLDSAEEVSWNREYRAFNGVKDGVELTVASHGVGAAGAAICFEELIKGGAREIIRVGTAGSLQQDITDGEIVIAAGAVRKDGLTEQLVPPEYPALADAEIIKSLEGAGERLGYETRTGVVLTIAAFYPEILPLTNNLYSRAGVIAVEMEASALFVIAALHGIKAGAVLAIDGLAIDFDADSYNPHREKVALAVDREIDLAITALVNHS
ncbi:MAG: nucleoside phosphorylase [Halanaerobium sp.]|nr:nucleoside phosphorylase [Halanaerobium sp.]